MCMRGEGRVRTIKIDKAVSVGICLMDHVLDFLVCKFLACSQKVITNENAIPYVSLRGGQNKERGTYQDLP
jgi:hypothetical protein